MIKLKISLIKYSHQQEVHPIKVIKRLCLILIKMVNLEEIKTISVLKYLWFMNRKNMINKKPNILLKVHKV